MCPNEYIVFLSREDRRQFEGYEPALLDELSSHLLEHAARESLALLTRPKVSFETDKRLRMGEFGIQARLVKPPATEREEASQGDLGATMVYSAAQRATRRSRSRPPERPTARALLTLNGKTFVIDQPRAVDGPQPAAATSCWTTPTSRAGTASCSSAARTGTWSTSSRPTASRSTGEQVSSSARWRPATRSWLGTSRLRFDVD